jgi:hypothetical protein
LDSIPGVVESGCQLSMVSTWNVCVRRMSPYHGRGERRGKTTILISKRKSLFLALGELGHGGDATQPALRQKSQWSTLVPLTSVSRPHLLQTDSETDFFDRVKKSSRNAHDFDPSKVRVESVIS